MSVITHYENYSYEVLTSNEDARVCAELTTDSFTKTNTITMSHGVTTQEHFEKISFPLINKALHQHLSLFARDQTTQEIVGCIIVTDFYLDQLYHQPYTGSYTLGYLFEELTEMFISNLHEELKPNTILYISLIATKQSQIGKGLATRLSQLACQHARQKHGFRYALVQVTHSATKHIYLKKFNGKVVSEIDPTTWIWKKGGNIIPYKEWTTEPLPNILFSLDEY